MSVIHQNTYVT